MKNRNILFLVVNFCTATFLVANSIEPFDIDDLDSDSVISESEIPPLAFIGSGNALQVPPPPPLLYFPHLDPQFQGMPKVKFPPIPPLLSKEEFDFYLQYKRNGMKRLKLSFSLNVSKDPIIMDPSSEESLSFRRFIKERLEQIEKNKESRRKSEERAKLETKNQEKFPCPVCKKYFLHRFILDSHLDNCHWPYVGTYASRRRYPSHSSNPVRFQQQGTDKKE